MVRRERPIAVFDVDGTIFRSSLFVELMKLMVREGILPKDAEEIYIDAHKRWLDREGGYKEYIDAMIDAFHVHIQGVHYADFAESAKQVVANQGKHTYRYTRDLLKQLRRDGYFLLAVSHSPKVILDQFCPRLGFDKTYGMMFDIGPGDRLTGQIGDDLIFNKSAIVKRAVEKEGLTFDGSIGVGDTESDISFLEIVEQPICFNPNSNLYRHAKLNGWKTVVERKDVVYTL